LRTYRIHCGGAGWIPPVLVHISVAAIASYSGGSVSVAVTRGLQGGRAGRLSEERRINSAELEQRGEGDAFRVSYVRDRECVMERDAEREGGAGGGGEVFIVVKKAARLTRARLTGSGGRQNRYCSISFIN
jgi:hypothetical protein